MRMSVVITNHNYERFVAEAIDSALGQRDADAELVVVDDGSTDGSRTVIESYRSDVTVVEKSNGGQGSAVNAGFGACTGDAVIFLDADDTLLPGAVARARGLLSAPSIATAHWPLWIVDERGEPTGRRWPAEKLPEGDLSPRLLSSPDYLTPPQSGHAYTREFLNEILPMPEAPFRTGADTYLFLLAPAFGCVAAGTEPMGTYRLHASNNYSGRGFDERMERLRAWFDTSLDSLEHQCRRRGIPARPEAWRRNTWAYRVSDAVARLDAIIPPRAKYVLADAGEWALTPSERRRPIPFPERDGRYWGPPPDDTGAIQELERLRDDGARFLVFGFPAFWWLDHYRGLREHVESKFSPVARDAEMIIYDLTR